jgi:hypothetical protein
VRGDSDASGVVGADESGVMRAESKEKGARGAAARRTTGQQDDETTRTKSCGQWSVVLWS